MPIIPARSGVSMFLRTGQRVKLINTHGHQVLDTWAFVLPSASKPSKQDRSAFAIEYMSMCHTRASLQTLRPCIGATMVTNRRNPILTLVKDTSPGVHDTLIAACDIYRYQGLIPELKKSGGYHENCSDNLHMALQDALPQVTNDVDGISLSKLIAHLKGWTPDPFNLFMNIPWRDGLAGNISFEGPKSKAGDFVELEAEQDCIVAVSACPQDVLKINGKNPVEAHYEILD